MKIIYNVFGHKGVGKDTVCEILKNIYGKEGKKIEHLSFASPLKDITWDLLSPYIKNRDCIYGTIEQKQQPLELIIPDSLRNKFEFFKDHKMWTGRLLLQFLGTEVFRSITDAYWTDKLIAKISETSNNVCISDCRFPNEYESLHNLPNIKVVDIKLVRPGHVGDSHASEAGVDGFNYDVIVENNDSLVHLYNRMEKLRDCYEF